MFKIKNITIKNFMSVGAVSQAVNFNEDELVLVLGENLDQGGDGSRNGVGKSTLVNALSYALYGEALVKIKKDNLVNKINAKGMLVTLEFEKDGVAYRIERGRRPNVFKFISNGQEVEADETDEAQGENRLTQKVIEETLDISHDMFKQIICLNTYNEPFLALRANDQRNLIEQLLGITKLSEKAEVLKVQNKEVKDALKSEEFKIVAIKQSNKTIEENIKSIEIKSRAWDKKKLEQIKLLETSIEQFSHVDINIELEKHKHNTLVKENNDARLTLDKELKAKDKSLQRANERLMSLRTDLTAAEEGTCPSCGQGTAHLETHEGYIVKLKEKVEDEQKYCNDLSEQIAELSLAIDTFNTDKKLEKTFYSSVEEAYEHKSTLQELENNLEKEKASENPYTDQIDTLRKTGIQEIDYTYINDLTSLRDHQDFLLKLLTNKDSFIRKKIIDQNLLFLNSRLQHYLNKVGLPHTVKFKSDLEVEITEFGRDYDFDNLSRGERTRLILSLSWAFRDVYESMNGKINLLFIDELIDSGLDTTGVEAALGVLKYMTREQHRNIFLISHREELVGRVTSVLKVVKEGGFTSFDAADTNLI